MPPCNDTTAPKWDESCPRELPQYFKELEYLFADCGITDNTQKKEYALQYISYDTAETWLGLPEFGNNISNNAPQPYTYQEWKLAVLRLYPGADASACYNLGDLEWLVNQTFNSGLATLGRFSDYYRDFRCIARWLLANGKLYRNEECRLFQQGIPMLLWSKIVCCLEITLPDHHPEDPYDVDQVSEGAKWVLKRTDTSMTKTSNGTSGIPSSLPITNAPTAPSPTPKRETLELTTTTAIVSALERLEALLTHGNAQPCQQFTNSTCHFCSEIGHTMGKVHQNAEGKIILPSGAMIPNYFGKRLYMEHIKEWHRLNPGQIVTGRLSSSTNPDPKQAAMQQSLIHKVMQQDITMGQVLSKEERIEALEHELFALSSTSAPAAKPADKGKASECTVINKQPPIAKEPIAQPPIHPFSGIPGHYVPPANRNFTAPDRTNDGTYQTMPPIYNIEQSKAVFKQVLSTKVTVSVGELCSVSQDIRNQFRTAVTPKQLVGTSANTVQDPSNIFKDILPTFAIEEPQFLLGSNVDTINGLTLDRAPFASVDPIEAYIDSLLHGEEPVVLTVTKDSQSLHTVMMLIDNKEEVECIHDSGSQIISMPAEIASDLGLSYDPNIVLNMQSANGTMDQLLGLA
ncbi:hypothetical protein J132_06115 [Termitomyces sp. J132]|nr:hypothetical protein J132_06115 [Termitomyces sp. J132]